MRACLTHPLGGYYMSNDVFGAQGDFTTSPEISQIFGELMGIWYVTQIQKRIQKGQKVQIVELGPGRGTLMADMVRTWSQLKGVTDAIDVIHLVEASPKLREMQAQKLECINVEVTPEGQKGITKSGIRVHWHEYLEEVPRGKTLLMGFN